MDEQNFKFNYVFQGQDCTLSTGVYKITIQNHVYIGSAAISFRKRWRQTKSIEQYDLDGNLIKVWDSINSIENGTDYKRKTIYACANGQNSTAYGYVWKYCR